MRSLLPLVLEDIEYLLVTSRLCVYPVVSVSMVQIQGVSALSTSVVLKWHNTLLPSSSER